MYLRPDEVAKVLEKSGFILDEIAPQSYGFRRAEHYVYVNRETRLGRMALIIHPALRQKSLNYAEPASELKSSGQYRQFPVLEPEQSGQHYGIPHGFSSRIALERYLNHMFGCP